MSVSIDSEVTGIIGCPIIWICPKFGDRTFVKVSNNDGDLSGSDVFSIDTESLNLHGNVRFISDDIIHKIKIFISDNIEIIIKFSNGDLYADELIDNLNKVTI